MPQIVIVETNGSLKELKCADVTNTELYKAIKLKNGTGFGLRCNWNVETLSISLYGKTDGRAGQENKYEFPPPVDSVLFFGKCVLVNNGGDLSVAEWKMACEQLFGGFDDLDSENEDDDDEDEYDDIPLTSSGYAKDGFVVESGSEPESESESEPESEQEQESEQDSESESKSKTKSKSKSKAKAKAKPKVKVKKSTVNKSAAADARLDYTDELVEEDYV